MLPSAVNETFDIGRLYVTVGPTLKQFSRSFAREAEEPYRLGRGVAIRYRPGRAIMIGWWDRGVADEDEGLHRMLDADRLDAHVEEIRQWR